MTAKKLHNLESIVKPILERYPEAREDDYFLYAMVITKHRPDLLKIPVSTFLVAHKELAIPSYESITRVRRKLQAKHPELASNEIRRERTQEEYNYIQYALEELQQ